MVELEQVTRFVGELRAISYKVRVNGRYLGIVAKEVSKWLAISSRDDGNVIGRFARRRDAISALRKYK